MRLVDRLSKPFSWNVVMSVALKESMSSIPSSATLMARSPMLLHRYFPCLVAVAELIQCEALMT